MQLGVFRKQIQKLTCFPCKYFNHRNDIMNDSFKERSMETSGYSALNTGQIQPMLSMTHKISQSYDLMVPDNNACNVHIQGRSS
jgi:hypothetical protein